MADRIVLNSISYHGKGAIENIVPELTAPGLRKRCLVCSDARPVEVRRGPEGDRSAGRGRLGLRQFTATSSPTPPLKTCSTAWPPSRRLRPTASWPSAAAPPWIPPRPSASLPTTPSSPTCASLEGVAPTKNHAVFTIAVPTTAGTAAEVTINYVITDVEKKRKFVCVDTNDIPDIAVVDPDMMSTMPKGLTAATGMDALTHAIEGYITKGALGTSAICSISRPSSSICQQPARRRGERRPRAAKAWRWASILPAWASPTWAWASCTRMAHGLGALYDTPHGVACAILLPTGTGVQRSRSGQALPRHRQGHGRGRHRHDGMTTKPPRPPSPP